MGNHKNQTESDFTAHERQMVEVVPIVMANTPDITIGGQKYTPPQIVQVYKQDASLQDDSQTALGDYHAKVALARDSRRKTRKFDKAFKKAAENEWPDGAQLGKLGFAPAPQQPTLATKVAAKEKTKNTRAVLHTMGKRQKKAAKRGGTSGSSGASGKSG